MKTKNFYTTFTKDTPQLAFQLEDKHKATFIFDLYERWDTEEDAIEDHRKNIAHAIEKLVLASKIAVELNYLVTFLLAYQKIESEEALEWEIEIDLNKLKFCKTMIQYIEEEYVEIINVILDYLQDQLVDEHEIEEDRVFFHISRGHCVVRRNIIKKGLAVPLEDGVYYGEPHPLPYQWSHDDEELKVLYKGKWHIAESVDFDFPFENLRIQ